MVNVILENKLAEFTMLENPVDMSKTYRVRCFLTPDEDVRLIRKLYDVKQQPKHPTF
jgi:uridine kinase